MATKQLVTAEQFLEMPEIPGRWFELARGELVEVGGTGAVHALIVKLFFRLLDSFVTEREFGEVFGDGAGYILDRDPDLVRVPDVSFVASSRLPEEGPPQGFFPFAPDLAVEIVSPGDRASDVYGKVREYLDAGTRAVWVAWPRHAAISVHTGADDVRELREDGELDGGDVLPGFRARVGDLLPEGVRA